jgi:hypothetical protein
MLRYDIVRGIILILSIIDFTLAAPVLVQEKRQAGVDVVRIPKDVITMLGRRGEEEIEKLAEEYIKTEGKQFDTSDAHASSNLAQSSSTPPGLEHGPTNVEQSPALNPVSSTADLDSDPLIEGSSPTPLRGSWEHPT